MVDLRKDSLRGLHLEAVVGAGVALVDRGARIAVAELALAGADQHVDRVHLVLLELKIGRRKRVGDQAAGDDLLALEHEAADLVRDHTLDQVALEGLGDLVQDGPDLRALSNGKEGVSE